VLTYTKSFVKHPSQMECDFRNAPSAYLITFCCYGKWLPGQSGAIDRYHHQYNGPSMPESTRLARNARCSMPGEACRLEAAARAVVLRALIDVCTYHTWRVMAIHVRSDHVHAVVSSDARPEIVMVVFKRYASRALNRGGGCEARQRWWARHGSTQYLWTKEEVSAAARYVVEGQGEPMACWAADSLL
jgi:REP element-mobilizing transposase RayT